jgi:hypothetical protein
MRAFKRGIGRPICAVSGAPGDIPRPVMKMSRQMIRDRVATDSEFRPGDKVVLADGPYQGTRGVFVKSGEDCLWAEIKEWNRRVRSHPVRWLRRENG